MMRPEPRRKDGGLRVEWDDVDWPSSEQLKQRVNGGLACAPRSDETLGDGGRRHGKTIAPIARPNKRRSRSTVVCVPSVEQTDQDACVQVRQSHSERNPSSSPGA